MISVNKGRLNLNRVLERTVILNNIISSNLFLKRISDSLFNEKEIYFDQGKQVVACLLDEVYKETTQRNAKLIIILSPHKYDFMQNSNDLLWLREYLFKRLQTQAA